MMPATRPATDRPHTPPLSASAVRVKTEYAAQLARKKFALLKVTRNQPLRARIWTPTPSLSAPSRQPTGPNVTAIPRFTNDEALPHIARPGIGSTLDRLMTNTAAQRV